MLVYCHAGIARLRVEPEGKTFDERLQTLARAIEIVKPSASDRPGSRPNTRQGAAEGQARRRDGPTRCRRRSSPRRPAR